MKKLHYFLNTILICILVFATSNSFGQLGKLKKDLTNKAKSVTSTDAKDVEEKVDDCLRYFDDLNEKENRIHMHIEDNKPKSADLSLIAYKNKIKKLKEENCPSANKYEERSVELEALIKQAHKDFECGEINNDLVHKEEWIVGQISKGVPDGNFVLGYVDEFASRVNELKESGCVEDISEYTTKIEDWKKKIKEAEISKDPFGHYAKAVNNDNKEEIDAALANGLGINDFNFYGYSPLSIAVEHANIDIIDYVLSNGADINLKNSEGRVALDYQSGYDELTDKDIEVKKHLISKGANPGLADIYYLGSKLIASGHLDYFMEFQANPDVKYTTDHYASFYWSAPDGSAVKKLSADKVKAGTIGKKFSDFKPGMTNPSLSSEMMAAANADDDSPKYTKMSIISKDWVIVRNELTGIIISRKIYGYGYGKTSDGICYVNEVRFVQYYDGSKYGKTLYAGWNSRKTVDCD